MSKTIYYSSVQNIQYFFACLFFASLNFEMFSPIIPDFSVAKMTSILYIAVSLLTTKESLSVRNIKKPLFSIFTMFFLMVFSSVIYKQDETSVFNITIFLNILMFWFLLNHSRQDNRVFNNGLLWFSVSSFIMGVLFYFNIGVEYKDMRVMLFGENANNIGVKMAVGLLFLLNYCLNHSDDRPIYRPWLLIMAVPMLLLLFATASRVSVLVISLGMIIFVLLRKTKKKSTKLLWLIVGVVILLYGLKIMLQQEVLMARMEETLTEGNIAGRDYIWEKYFDLFISHPILGVGFTGAHKYSIEVFGQTLSPHNVLLEVAVYSGIVGLACFVRFLIFVFYDSWLYYKKKNILGPMVTNMAIVGMIVSGQALGVKLFWVIAAYSISGQIILNGNSVNNKVPSNDAQDKNY